MTVLSRGYLLTDSLPLPTTMASTAVTLLQFVMYMTWEYLCDTPFARKNALFARFFTSLQVLESTASIASLTFTPGLSEVLQSSTPPTIQIFKSLPTTHTKSRWGVYAIVLEKFGSRPRLYIGSGTSTDRGVHTRLRRYKYRQDLPCFVEAALEDGYTITHKGLLCWIQTPTASFVPARRLLFLTLEATFTYIFWAMQASKGDYVMGHLCLWDRASLEYDGSCSHCCLTESIPGDFSLTPEQLEAQDIDKKRKLAALNSDNHHYQMESNYEEYRSKRAAGARKTRAKNPGRATKDAADRRAKHKLEKTYHCGLCNHSFGSKFKLRQHEKSLKHIRKMSGKDIVVCRPCNTGFCSQANNNRH
jgi:hypothetical protein